MSNNDERNAPDEHTKILARHESRPDKPPDPTIRILFHGLFCFTFDGTRHCKAGIHNTTQSSPEHPHPHEFKINMWTIDGSCPPAPVSFNIRQPKLISGVGINVVNPLPTWNGVYTYERTPWDRLNPAASDPEDWRWIVDLESAYMYPEGIRFKPDTITPSVVINNGLFYTLHKTTSKFVLRPDDHTADRPVGNVAEIMACNIYLGTGGIATLSVLPIPFPLVMIGGRARRYQIDIINNCRKNGRICNFDPGSANPHDRNDFYLYYDTFDIPTGRPRLDLVKTEHSEPPQSPIICAERSGSKSIVSSNDSPCGPAFAGQGNGN